MSAAVLGASGHLGAHLCRVLLREGERVRAVVRKTSRLEALDALPVERAFGDLLDPPEVLSRALSGCRAVYLIGAPTDGSPEGARTIVTGTRNALTAARTAGAERVVYTSSIVTVGYSADPAVVLDERSSTCTPATPYHTAKWQAEQAVLEFTHKTGFPVVVVNPATIIGSLDYRVTPSTAPLARCLSRGLPVAPTGGVTVVHAEDVARGHLLAMRHGRPGERYILGGDRVALPEYFRTICRICDQSPPRVALPRGATCLMGLGFSFLHWLTGRPVPFTARQARLLAGRYGWYSSAKAQIELGYRWRPVEDAIRDYVTWARTRLGPPAAATGRAA
jgi:dihydroflavonol-4-reductase